MASERVNYILTTELQMYILRQGIFTITAFARLKLAIVKYGLNTSSFFM